MLVTAEVKTAFLEVEVVHLSMFWGGRLKRSLIAPQYFPLESPLNLYSAVRRERIRDAIKSNIWRKETKQLSYIQPEAYHKPDIHEVQCLVKRSNVRHSLRSTTLFVRHFPRQSLPGLLFFSPAFSASELNNAIHSLLRHMRQHKSKIYKR